ncbi:uncharacterized protein K444DRAFT_193706 [Hyaloscypha bicolor E]|uniref:Uncharacterized protein n=1 Tax=Hyaloscypha bicolor E TaxID=1095630 RepID=A0A2J6SQ58_9HELO|nr:uncharacterized protein K444DRAFT_193706 [Hyaloscypha bicolor E]PMD52899.1 hypothetical protein K444DRAFT_193706 [Hyaloscypha bicolor E]
MGLRAIFSLPFFFRIWIRQQFHHSAENALPPSPPNNPGHLANPRDHRAIISHPDPPPNINNHRSRPRRNNNQHFVLQRVSLHPAIPPREALPKRIQRVHHAVLFLVLEIPAAALNNSNSKLWSTGPGDFTPSDTFGVYFSTRGSCTQVVPAYTRKISAPL